MSGCSLGPTKFLIASPSFIDAAAGIVWPLPSRAQEPALGIEGPQHRELIVRRRLGHFDPRRLEQGKAGVLANGVGRDTRVSRLDPHALAVRVEPENAERSNDARDATEAEAGRAARAVAPEPRRARDEVDALDEAPLLVRRDDDDLAAQRGDIVRAARAGQADSRLPVVGAEHASVDVAVPVDLRAVHEADVHEAALGEEERVGDA